MTRLCAAGYDDFALLGRKCAALHRLANQQLSSQRHYDFGLRSALVALRAANVAKRQSSGAESMLLVRALRDTHCPKLVAEDVPIFLSLLKDIFLGASVVDDVGGSVEATLLVAAAAAMLQKKLWYRLTVEATRGNSCPKFTFSGLCRCSAPPSTVLAAETRAPLRRDSSGSPISSDTLELRLADPVDFSHTLRVCCRSLSTVFIRLSVSRIRKTSSSLGRTKGFLSSP